MNRSGNPGVHIKNILVIGAVLGLLSACTFNYSEFDQKTSRHPDLQMEDLDYIRVRDGKTVLRFKAESAERYEDEQLMRVHSLAFEQYSSGERDAVGRAGLADMELNTGNSRLENGVYVFVPSDELAIETEALFWDDKTRMLYGDRDALVQVTQSDGSILQGSDFSADLRRRTWSFDSTVSGTFVEDNEEDSPDSASEDQTVSNVLSEPQS